MLETIREFAAERLDESGEADELRPRHAEHFLALAEEADAHREGGEPVDPNSPEHDNLRAAFEVLSVSDDVALTARLVYARSGLLPSAAEQARWYDAVLPHADDLPALQRAGLLRRAGGASYIAGELARSARLQEDSLAAYDELGDRVWGARMRQRLASTVHAMGDVERARAFSRRASGKRRPSRCPGIYRALHGLGELELDVGQLDRAARLLERSASLARDAGDEFDSAHIGHGRADVALKRGDLTEAKRLYRAVLEASHYVLMHPRMTAYCLASLAAVAASAGDCERGGRLWGATEALEAETGWRVLERERPKYEERIAICAERAPMVFAAAAARGRSMTLREAVEYALGEE